MKTKPILWLILAACILLALFVQSKRDLQIQAGQLPSVTPVLWPPPTESREQIVERQKRAWSTFDQANRDLGVDLSCAIPCWSTFVPGQTTLREVLALLNERVKLPPGSFIGTSRMDDTAPNNTTGGGIVRAYSDATQPLPLLRTYEIRVRINSSRLSVADVLPLLPQSVTQFFPDAMLARPRELPRISVGGIGKRGDTYLLNYEYPTWAIQYLYERAEPFQAGTELCPQDQLREITIWVYSAREQGFNALFDDILHNYPNSGNITLGESAKSRRTSYLDAKQFQADLQAGRCTAIPVLPTK